MPLTVPDYAGALAWLTRWQEAAYEVQSWWRDAPVPVPPWTPPTWWEPPPFIDVTVPPPVLTADVAAG